MKETQGAKDRGKRGLPMRIKELIEGLGLIPHPEGGFFAETYRSGCEPMVTRGQTGFDCTSPTKDLVIANGRSSHRPDGDERRNAMTSIFWVPTIKSPKLLLAYNCSDHIHYYQGGRPFQYTIFDPSTQKLHHEILGPDLHQGHKMQVCVRGGLWKCGEILTDGDPIDENNEYEYALIGEAVAPGFDFHDFTVVTEELLKVQCEGEDHRSYLMQFVHDDWSKIQNEEKTVQETDQFYDEDVARNKRIDERS